jgi:hypothetical protein
MLDPAYRRIKSQSAIQPEDFLIATTGGFSETVPETPARI